MKLTTLAVRQRTSVLVFLLIVIVLGVTAYRDLPRESAPELNIPNVMVSSHYEGTSPSDMESLVTLPIERKLANLNEVKEIASTSSEGQSVINVEFEADTDMGTVVIDSTNVAVSYDALTNTATFSLAPLLDGTLINANYTFTLQGSEVTDAMGTPVATDEVLTGYYLAGDADGSRSVNLADFGILRANFGTGGGSLFDADFNLDGSVNLTDFGILRANFGASVAAPSSLFADDELFA